jgi:hypothetical protein
MGAAADEFIFGMVIVSMMEEYDMAEWCEEREAKKRRALSLCGI